MRRFLIACAFTTAGCGSEVDIAVVDNVAEQADIAVTPVNTCLTEVRAADWCMIRTDPSAGEELCTAIPETCDVIDADDNEGWLPGACCGKGLRQSGRTYQYSCFCCDWSIGTVIRYEYAAIPDPLCDPDYRPPPNPFDDATIVPRGDGPIP